MLPGSHMVQQPAVDWSKVVRLWLLPDCFCAAVSAEGDSWLPLHSQGTVALTTLSFLPQQCSPCGPCFLGGLPTHTHTLPVLVPQVLAPGLEDVEVHGKAMAAVPCQQKLCHTCFSIQVSPVSTLLIRRGFPLCLGFRSAQGRVQGLASQMP